MIESTFGLHSLTARDANAMDLRQVLQRKVGSPVPASAIPTSGQVPGPASDAAAFCSILSVQSVSPAPVSKGTAVPADQPGPATVNGMGALARRYQKATIRKP